MSFTELISNLCFQHISEQILNELNYQDLKNCCETSSTLNFYIKNHNLKWQLFENLQELRQETIKPWKNMEMVPENLFKYYEEKGTIEELSLLIDFIQIYIEDNASWEVTSPFATFVTFAVCHIKRIDFVMLLIPVLEVFESANVRKYSNFSLLHSAVCTNHIEMVKLLMKHSQEKNLDIYHKTRYNIDDDLEFWEKETILELATRLRFVKPEFDQIAQLIQNVYDGKIRLEDL